MRYNHGQWTSTGREACSAKCSIKTSSLVIKEFLLGVIRGEEKYPEQHNEAAARATREREVQGVWNPSTGIVQFFTDFQILTVFMLHLTHAVKKVVQICKSV